MLTINKPKVQKFGINYWRTYIMGYDDTGNMLRLHNLRDVCSIKQLSLSMLLQNYSKLK